MKIALVQYCTSTDSNRNIERGLGAVEDAAAAGAELILFPELSFTRFFPQRRLQGDRLHLAEPIPGPTTHAFSAAARRLGVVIVLNMFERDGDSAFDSSPVIDSDVGESPGVTRVEGRAVRPLAWKLPGDTGAPVYDTAVGRIGVAICYDRHYPEYLRGLALAGAELVLIPQAGSTGEWPEGVFEAEIQCGAFQNGFFMALANRVGREEVLTFAGESLIVDPRGQIIAQAQEGQETIMYADLDLSLVDRSPARTLFLKHRRSELYVDGGICAWPLEK